MIIPIKHKVYWELIRQKKQAQNNKNNMRENIHRVEYDYKVGYNVILTRHTSYKYEIPYMGPFVITQCFTNGTVNLQCDMKTIMYNILHINTYKQYTKV